MREYRAPIAALILALGLATAGWFARSGVRGLRTDDRVVSVKGIAERQVKADLSLWPMRLVATSNQLSEAQGKVAHDTETVIKFFESGGVARDSIQIQGLEVTDVLATAYRQGPVGSRFIVAQTLMVRTMEVDKIVALSQKQGEVVSAGVVLSSEGIQGPFFLFTGLNSVKPAMIAEATKNARAGAQQFAADSGSRLGGIRQASQGLFQILPRDDAPGQAEQKQVFKTVRVVSTVEYQLVD